MEQLHNTDTAAFMDVQVCFCKPNIADEYLQSNPIHILNFADQIFTTEIINPLNGVFKFYNINSIHYSDNYILITLLLFLGFIFFAYPKEIKSDSKTRIGVILLILIIILQHVSFNYLLGPMLETWI